MIICLEGASAVGKTSTCHLLAERGDAYIVPEVNALYERPADASTQWYLERQVDRWRAAKLAGAPGKLSVLDGDPLQPLWYSWSSDFPGMPSLAQVRDFYRPLIASGAIGFPDTYVLLTAGEDELRRRKAADPARSRRNFDSHLRLMDTLPQYFKAMESLAPPMVHIVDAVSLDANWREIAKILGMRREPLTNGLALFDGLTDWLEQTQPPRLRP